jgi:hypothetical protein
VTRFAPLYVGAPGTWFKKQIRGLIGAGVRLWQRRTAVAIVAALAFGIAA